MIKKLNNMLYCTRTTAKSNVRTNIINIFYNFTIGGVLRYCVAAWCDNGTKADIEHIDSIIREANKVIRIPQPNIDSIYTLPSIKLDMVWTDNKHPLCVYHYCNIISRGSGRLSLTTKSKSTWKLVHSSYNFLVKVYANDICCCTAIHIFFFHTD